MERRRFTREFKLEAVRLIGITGSRTRRHRSLTRHGAFIPRGKRLPASALMYAGRGLN
jgi:hypothetical protein